VLQVDHDGKEAGLGAQRRPVVIQVVEAVAEGLLAEPLGRAAFDLDEARDAGLGDDGAARPLHPDEVARVDLAPRHGRARGVGLGEDPDLGPLARAGDVVVSTDDDVCAHVTV